MPMTPPLSLALAVTAPALFPDLSPVAVWLGLGCMALALWAWRRADHGLGNCEGWIRQDQMATEARAWLAVMCDRRVG